MKIHFLLNCYSVVNDVVAAECCNPAIGGTYGDAYFIPYELVNRDATSGSVVTDNVISSIILKEIAGAKAAKVDNLENVHLGEVSVEVGTYVTLFQHDVTTRFLLKNEEVKKFINSLPCSRWIIILHNKELGTDKTVSYEAYGWDSGLKLTELTGTTEVADGVVYEITLGNDDTSKEKSLPKTVYAGSISATEAMLESLLTPYTPPAG